MKWDDCTGFIAIALLSSPITEQNKDIRVHFRQLVGRDYIGITNKAMLKKTLADVLSMQGLQYSLTR